MRSSDESTGVIWLDRLYADLIGSGLEVCILYNPRRRLHGDFLAFHQAWFAPQRALNETTVRGNPEVISLFFRSMLCGSQETEEEIEFGNS